MNNLQIKKTPSSYVIRPCQTPFKKKLTKCLRNSSSQSKRYKLASHSPKTPVTHISPSKNSNKSILPCFSIYRPPVSLITPRNYLNFKKPPKSTHSSVSVVTVKKALMQIKIPKPSYFSALKFSLKQLKCYGLTPSQFIASKDSIPSKPFDRKDSTKVIKLAKEGNLLELKQLVTKDRWLVHVLDSMQMTPLHWASLRNHKEVASFLIQNNCFIDAIDLSHRTPLFIATRAGNEEMLNLLIQHGADSWIRSSSGKLPLRSTKDYNISRTLQKTMLHQFSTKYKLGFS